MNKRHFMLYLKRTSLLAVCLMVLSAVPFVTAQEPTDDLFIITVSGKRGFINKTGKVVIEPQFEEAEDFSEGFAAVRVGNRWGYIDKTGSFLIEPKFGSSHAFFEGLAVNTLNEFFDRSRTKWILLRKNGKFIELPQIIDIDNKFSEGLIAAKNDKGKWGYLDTKGNVVIPFEYRKALAFSEGLACVLVDDKYGFIDHKGKFVIEPRFTRSQFFSDGLAAVKLGGQLFITDGDFEPIREEEFSLSRWVIINKNGNEVANLRDDVSWVGRFSEGLALTQIKKKKKGFSIGFIDKNGTFIIQPRFYEAADFSNGLAHAIVSDNVERPGFINRSGKLVYSTNNATLGSFRNGLARIQEGYTGLWYFDKTHKQGYIDKTGRIIWKPSN